VTDTHVRSHQPTVNLVQTAQKVGDLRRQRFIQKTAVHFLKMLPHSHSQGSGNTFVRIIRPYLRFRIRSGLA
jgi:hypothetical protein